MLRALIERNVDTLRGNLGVVGGARRESLSSLRFIYDAINPCADLFFAVGFQFRGANLCRVSLLDDRAGAGADGKRLDVDFVASIRNRFLRQERIVKPLPCSTGL